MKNSLRDESDWYIVWDYVWFCKSRQASDWLPVLRRDIPAVVYRI